MKTITIELDAYEAANLLWFLKRAWVQVDPMEQQIPCPNSGDWVGQIPTKIQAAMTAAGGEFLTQRANNNADPFENAEWVHGTPAGHYEWKTPTYRPHDAVTTAVRR